MFVRSCVRVFVHACVRAFVLSCIRLFVSSKLGQGDQSSAACDQSSAVYRKFGGADLPRDSQYSKTKFEACLSRKARANSGGHAVAEYMMGIGFFLF